MSEDLIKSIYKNKSHKKYSIEGGYLYYDEDTGRLKVVKENQQLGIIHLMREPNE